jgi:hypothetical protein
MLGFGAVQAYAQIGAYESFKKLASGARSIVEKNELVHYKT